MGCDIHLYAEVKIGGKWHNYGRLPFVRWYEAFEKLAGVRGDVRNAIAPPRGLPPDVSEVVKFQSDYDSGHSHSWISAGEIAEFCEWLEKKPPYKLPKLYKDRFDFEWETGMYFFGNSFAGFALYPSDAPKGIQDLRFVFWFDN